MCLEGVFLSGIWGLGVCFGMEAGDWLCVVEWRVVVGDMFLCEWWGFLLCLGVHCGFGLIFWGGVWATALVHR